MVAEAHDDAGVPLPAVTSSRLTQRGHLAFLLRKGFTYVHYLPFSGENVGNGRLNRGSAPSGRVIGVYVTFFQVFSFGPDFLF